MFHDKDGLFFTRNPDGGVTITRLRTANILARTT